MSNVIGIGLTTRIEAVSHAGVYSLCVPCSIAFLIQSSYLNLDIQSRIKTRITLLPTTLPLLPTYQLYVVAPIQLITLPYNSLNCYKETRKNRGRVLVAVLSKLDYRTEKWWRRRRGKSARVSGWMRLKVLHSLRNRRLFPIHLIIIIIINYEAAQVSMDAVYVEGWRVRVPGKQQQSYRQAKSFSATFVMLMMATLLR